MGDSKIDERLVAILERLSEKSSSQDDLIERLAKATETLRDNSEASRIQNWDEMRARSHVANQRVWHIVGRVPIATAMIYSYSFMGNQVRNGGSGSLFEFANIATDEPPLAIAKASFSPAGDWTLPSASCLAHPKWHQRLSDALDKDVFRDTRARLGSSAAIEALANAKETRFCRAARMAFSRQMSHHLGVGSKRSIFDAEREGRFQAIAKFVTIDEARAFAGLTDMTQTITAGAGGAAAEEVRNADWWSQPAVPLSELLPVFDRHEIRKLDDEAVRRELVRLGIVSEEAS
jgi:hypothetical protein